MTSTSYEAVMTIKYINREISDKSLVRKRINYTFFVGR